MMELIVIGLFLTPSLFILIINVTYKLKCSLCVTALSLFHLWCNPLWLIGLKAPTNFLCLSVCLSLSLSLCDPGLVVLRSGIVPRGHPLTPHDHGLKCLNPLTIWNLSQSLLCLFVCLSACLSVSLRRSPRTSKWVVWFRHTQIAKSFYFHISFEFKLKKKRNYSGER